MLKKFKAVLYWFAKTNQLRMSFKKSKLPNDHEVDFLVEHFRGIRVWNTLSPFDWLLWSRKLYSKNLILIGGHKGASLQLILKNLPDLNLIHVYEPVQEYFDHILESLKSDKVTVYNEAVFDGLEIEMIVGGDGSLIASTNRELPSKIPFEYTAKANSVSLETAVQRLGTTMGNYSLFMNCEGSEYKILNQVSALKIGPQSIFVQNHTATDKPFVNLFLLRAKLAEQYYPKLCTNWAWDVWLRKDLVSQSTTNLEQAIV